MAWLEPLLTKWWRFLCVFWMLWVWMSARGGDLMQSLAPASRHNVCLGRGSSSVTVDVNPYFKQMSWPFWILRGGEFLVRSDSIILGFASSHGWHRARRRSRRRLSTAVAMLVTCTGVFWVLFHPQFLCQHLFRPLVCFVRGGGLNGIPFIPD